MNKRLEKSMLLATSLLIAFVSNDWFQQAWKQPTNIGKWMMVIVALFFLSLATYFILDKNGNL
ncbi:hypothetical protein J4476_04845 [Candidatus Woesearchaeota archaeon]|nr:MAG: hypothetical protein QT09_C0004G0033 [archaeon GW2011_AR18]MBS3161991.1 hypothetical protein [Candidatus Woesearchaeota archaeon]HIH25850.1 hypothetical protein [Nanoarchaeota archaeon]